VIKGAMLTIDEPPNKKQPDALDQAECSRVFWRTGA
jgi:hypothetical protein